MTIQLIIHRNKYNLILLQNKKKIFDTFYYKFVQLITNIVLLKNIFILILFKKIFIIYLLTSLTFFSHNLR